VEPAIAYFGLVHAGVPASRAVQIHDLTGNEFNIVRVAGSSDDNVQIQSTTVFPRRASTHDLTIEFTPPPEPGAYRSEVVVYTDRADCESIPIPVVAVVSRK
jgi:hypothetical protein